MGVEDADFSGYATKANLRCADGRTIMPEAFKHMDGQKVPLVWQHGHGVPENILGHAILEARPDGIYSYGFFNGTDNGIRARSFVQHGDVDTMSIWANRLVERAGQVFHGFIREVSLVISGANPGAKIDFVRIKHSDDPSDDEILSDEVVIHSGETYDFIREPTEEESVEHAEDGMTVQDVLDTLNEEQMNVVKFLIGSAVEAAEKGELKQSDDKGEDEDLTHQEEEGTGEMRRNVFENNKNKETDGELRHSVSRADVQMIARKVVTGQATLKHALEEYALSHGVENLEVLFPDAKAIADRPEFDKRRTEWVSSVLGGVHKTPFSRIKTLSADITQDEARAKGYVKGEYKKEEWFSIQKRTTGPTTIYKKQSFDRDDIIDITDFDFIAWVKFEMRLMLEEEIATAILIGDGRDVSDEDKIKDPLGASSGDGIRSIVNDHELYVTTVYVNIGDANSNYSEIVDELVRARTFYKGSGNPTFYTTEAHISEFMLLRDSLGRKIYETMDSLKNALRVRDIVAVETMEREGNEDLVGVIVNLADYNTGTDKGGEVNLFDDFDIDYNKLKYLMETRLSGALTKIKSALVVRTVASDLILATPSKPSFVASTGVVTIPTVTGVVYKDEANVTISAGAMAALDPGESVDIHAVPATGYYFRNTAQDQWKFKRPAA